MDTPPHPALGNIVGPAAVLSSVPPPYQPVNVRHLESQSSSEEPQDYLWLVNCESKKPEPNRWVCLGQDKLILCVWVCSPCALWVLYCDISFSLCAFLFVHFICTATLVLVSAVWCVAQCSFTLYWRETRSICSWRSVRAGLFLLRLVCEWPAIQLELPACVECYTWIEKNREMPTLYTLCCIYIASKDGYWSWFEFECLNPKQLSRRLTCRSQQTELYFT